jgi:hypothetical protein
MLSFLQKHHQHIHGVLSGFDRLVFHGLLRPLLFVGGMMGYLWREKVLLKDFGDHAHAITKELKVASLQHAQDTGREIRYLPSSQTCKEDVAREIAQRDGIQQGLLGVLTCVEPCLSYDIFKNRTTYKLELQPRQRKCLHLYHYQIHPEFGFIHARIQTWFPFSIQVYLNGREWLARQMDRAGISYRRRDNCFTWIEDVPAAQSLCLQQLTTDFNQVLQGIAQDLNPAHARMFAASPMDYTWYVHQSEWATDVMFRSRAALERVYPRFLRHAILAFGPGDILRFLGHKVLESGAVPARFSGEIITDVKERCEGYRIKHHVDENSLKLYDKGSVLRPEMTINEPSAFRVDRPRDGDPTGPEARRPLRKSVEDLGRRAELCQAANERYLEALAAVADEKPLRELVEPLAQPVTLPAQNKVHGRGKTKVRQVRALNPWAGADGALLQAVAQPCHLQNGLRNRDLVRALYPEEASSKAEQRRRSAQVTRKLTLLRAHGIIAKVPHTHRYLVTVQGRQILTALLAVREANTDFLTSKAG